MKSTSLPGHLPQWLRWPLSSAAHADESCQVRLALQLTPDAASTSSPGFLTSLIADPRYSLTLDQRQRHHRHCRSVRSRERCSMPTGHRHLEQKCAHREHQSCLPGRHCVAVAVRQQRRFQHNGPVAENLRFGLLLAANHSTRAKIRPGHSAIDSKNPGLRCGPDVYRWEKNKHNRRNRVQIEEPASPGVPVHRSPSIIGRPETRRIKHHAVSIAPTATPLPAHTSPRKRSATESWRSAVERDLLLLQTSRGWSRQRL